MNKAAIKNFSVRARSKLIKDITQKAYSLGIKGSGKYSEIETFEGGFRIKESPSRIFSKDEASQREALIDQVELKGFEQVIEEVAYTWFNRIIAIRFMEANDYLPAKVRILSSSAPDKTEPDILSKIYDYVDEFGLDKQKVFELKEGHRDEELFKYVFVRQCNKLGEIMSGVFEEIADYTELLLPDHLLVSDSVIRELVETIEEDDFREQVEIIGWMYQYYISEKKDEVFEGLRKNKKITKENIPAATQLFTPKWIVKYMVENSLGRLWQESHPDEELKKHWEYYIEPAEQDEDVKRKLDELKDPSLSPEKINILDPAMGSGHILVYAFDVLYDIYLSRGYREKDIPKLILENNLYGLDIDDRAGQLATFALLMKARNKNKNILNKPINLNVCAIQESNGFPKEAIDFLVNPNATQLEKNVRRDEVEYLVKVFNDAKDYGSIIEVKAIDFDAIEKRLEEIRNGDTSDLFELQYRNVILSVIPDIVKQAKIMSQKYDVAVTNPPYLSARKSIDSKLSDYIAKNYNNYKNDMFAVFVNLLNRSVKKEGFFSIIIQQSFMFLNSFSKSRKELLNNAFFDSFLQLGTNTFEEINGEVVQSISFSMRKNNIRNYQGKFYDITKSNDKEKYFLDNKYTYSLNSTRNFHQIPNDILAYWVTDKVINLINTSNSLGEKYDPKVGLATGYNDKFIRRWFEIPVQRFSIYSNENDNIKWYPYNKGGSYRKWYGNREYVIDWLDDGANIKLLKNERLIRGEIEKKNSKCWNEEHYLKESLSWSKVSSGNFAIRYYEHGFIFDVAGCSIVDFGDNKQYLCGVLNSKLNSIFIESFSPTLNFETNIVRSFPLIQDNKKNHLIEEYVEASIQETKNDWDSFETSWDFKVHPLIQHKKDSKLVSSAFKNWSEFAENQFNQLKANEEELNRIFIEIYGLQDELTPEVEDADITVSKADAERDIKSFISYAVGCMLGRYSLDEEGLIFAGGEFELGRYKSFIPDDDNVLVITEDDYFEDDITNRFVEFVKVSFGVETLEENLNYIANVLSPNAKDTARNIIRKYFIKDFYKDHVKTYKKRPIYWMLDSGKGNAFKALFYLHRYDKSTIARIRTEYLHKLQKMYENDIEITKNSSESSDAKSKKRIDTLNKKLAELQEFDKVVAHIAYKQIELDLDDGVDVNYEKFQEVEVPQGEGRKPIKANLLAKRG